MAKSERDKNAAARDGAGRQREAATRQRDAVRREGDNGGTQRKLAQIRRRQRLRSIRIRVLAGVGAAVVVAAIAAGVALATGGGDGSQGKKASALLGPEGVALENGPALAPASTAATGQAIDGISCSATEQAVYHIHAHLAVYVNGAARQIPLGIGVVEPSVSQSARGPFASATRCYYWLHTHAADGIIHAESPVQRAFTLGAFFDIWRQPLNGHQAGRAKGTVTAFVNGARYSGDPRAIRLTSRAAIQLDVGRPVPPRRVDWSRSQL